MAYGSYQPSVPSTSVTSNNFNITAVDVRTRRAMADIIKSTWDPEQVGKGRDAGYLEHTDISFTNILKVHNSSLLASYTQLRDNIYRKTRGSAHRSVRGIPPELDAFNKTELLGGVNEFYLFHGTEKHVVTHIVNEGLDPKETSPTALYGQGIYFAEEFTKADQYADDRRNRTPPGTELTVLLCRVVLGRFFPCHKDDAKKWKRPPCSSQQFRYDSVLGSGHGMLFREFVIYERFQCYPEYIIKYKRVGGDVSRLYALSALRFECDDEEDDSD